MNKDDYHNIEQEVEETLDSLENLEPAVTDPYFVSRLQARLKNGQDQKEFNIWEFFLQPKVSLSIACVLIIVNISLLIWSDDRSFNEKNERANLLKMVANDYALDATPYKELYD